MTATVGIVSTLDDVEQSGDGPVLFESGDLDVATGVTVGTRFQICVPVGAPVLNATLTLTADEVDTTPTIALIQGEASPDAAPFSAVTTPSARVRTTASVAWVFTTEWSPGTIEASPDISAIINEIVSSPEWNGCGSVVLFLEGTGDREAVSFDTDPLTAPSLEITYQP